MKANIRSIRKHRKYSEDFKRRIVADFEEGKFSVPQLHRFHGWLNLTGLALGKADSFSPC